MVSVKLHNHCGGIQIKIQLEGRRYTFSPVRRGKYNNFIDLGQAQRIANQIELDISEGKFDSTLSAYKPHSPRELKRLLDNNQRDLELIRRVEEQKKPTFDIKELWNQYVEYKTYEGVSITTINVDYKRRVGNTLEKMPSSILEDAISIRDWLLKNTTPSQTKKILTQLNACCNWAVDSRLIKSNPFTGLGQKIKVKKEEGDINPFTDFERDKIVLAFKENRYYKKYYYLVKFIFYVGCRPSEALALTWDDIRNNEIVFNKAYVEGNKQNRLKTQKKRVIRINNQVISLLDELREYQEETKIKNPYLLLFPSSKDGNYLDWHNFNNRAWKTVLGTLADIEYRNPYQMRHTYITLALKAGVSLTDVARYCGNSPKTILEKYAGFTRDFLPPYL